MRDGYRRWLLRGAVVAVAFVVALVAWRATDESGEDVSIAPETSLRIVSPRALSDVVAATGHLVYWAGPMPGATLAVSEAPGGIVQVRYFEEESELEGEGGGGEALTVGSYPMPDPATALANLAASPGAIVKHSRAGVELVTTEENPNSVYLASPENSVQVEVSSAAPRRAMALARSGRVRPAS